MVEVHANILQEGVMGEICSGLTIVNHQLVVHAALCE